MIIVNGSPARREVTGPTRDFGPMAARWIVSVDLGQAIDPTAIAVLEVTTREMVRNRFWAATEAEQATMPEPPKDWYESTGNEWRLKWPKIPARIDVRHLERLPLRVSYPDQMAHVAALLRRPPLDRARPKLLCDSTGVGRPVVDIARRAGLQPIGVTITAGSDERRVSDGPGENWHVAKLLLVSRLQAALHSGVLHVSSKLREARTLMTELEDFRGIFTDSGYARFGAREGAHDDVLLALAMGVWYASRDHATATWTTVLL